MKSLSKCSLKSILIALFVCGCQGKTTVAPVRISEIGSNKSLTIYVDGDERQTIEIISRCLSLSNSDCSSYIDDIRVSEPSGDQTYYQFSNVNDKLNYEFHIMRGSSDFIEAQNISSVMPVFATLNISAAEYFSAMKTRKEKNLSNCIYSRHYKKIASSVEGDSKTILMHIASLFPSDRGRIATVLKFRLDKRSGLELVQVEDWINLAQNINGNGVSNLIQRDQSDLFATKCEQAATEGIGSNFYDNYSSKTMDERFSYLFEGNGFENKQTTGHLGQFCNLEIKNGSYL